MAKCWETFGEGLIEDVFKEGDPTGKKCFVCYTASFRETSKFKGEIKSVEIRKYLIENPYIASAKGDNCKVNGGFCIDTGNKEDCGSKISADPSYLLIHKEDAICKKNGKNGCCYTEYACWNKGGKCAGTNPDESQYSQYTKWECPSGMKCFVKKGDFYSYADYVQRFGGPGNMLILTDIKPGDTYAISFGSPTGQCSWCTYAGLIAGATGVIVVGIATGGTGWAVLAGAGAYALIKGGSEATVREFSDFFKRNVNTIYLTTLNDIQKENHCGIVSDIRGS